MSTHAGSSDPLHHLVAAEMVGGDSPPGNNNEMSAVYIYNEHGGLVKKLETFNLYVTGLPVNANDMQLNFISRTGYILATEWKAI